MIGYLEGTPKIVGNNCLIMVQGVGYQVELSPTTLMNISTQNHVELYIYTHVREDCLELFGFLTVDEKSLFEALLSVSGVGPRSALALTALGPSQLIQAVQQADTTVLTQVPRVGKKLAQKIIIDLKSKLGSLKDIDLTPPTPAKQELIQALAGLGFSEKQINDTVAQIDVESEDLQTALKHSLKILGQRS